MFQILTAVKDGLQKYYATAYSRSGVNQMWILRNSKELLDNLKSMFFSKVDSIKTFDVSTLHTTIPQDKLKSSLEDLISYCFFYSNWKRRYKYIVLGRQKITMIALQSLRRLTLSVCWSSFLTTFRGVRRTNIPTNNWHSNGYLLCPTTC